MGRDWLPRGRLRRAERDGASNRLNCGHEFSAFSVSDIDLELKPGDHGALSLKLGLQRLQPDFERSANPSTFTPGFFAGIFCPCARVALSVHVLPGDPQLVSCGLFLNLKTGDQIFQECNLNLSLGTGSLHGGFSIACGRADEPLNQFRNRRGRYRWMFAQFDGHGFARALERHQRGPDRFERAAEIVFALTRPLSQKSTEFR